jgi:putative transport protein
MKIFIKHRGLLCLLLILCLTLTMTVCAAAEDAAENEPARPNVVVDYLTSHAPLLLFICIGLGYIVGKITIKNKNHVRIFTVGPTAGTLLVGLIVSQFISVELPAALSTVFFSLFCFAIGFEVGPSFFASLKNTDIKIVAMAAFFALTGLGTAYAVCRIAGFDVGVGVGMLAGALTQTSIIGAASLDADMASNATVAYALTYVFGTLGVILFMKNVAPLLLGKKLPIIVKDKVDKMSAGSSHTPVSVPKSLLQLRAYLIQEHSEYVGRTVDQFENSTTARVEVVAVYRGGESMSLIQNHKLLVGDVIQVVGDVDALNLADDKGLREVTDPAYYQVQVVSRKIILTEDFTENGRDLLSEYGLLITNSGGKVSFKKGSIVTVTGSEKAIEKAAKRMGYIKEEGNVTDIAFLSLAIAAGLFIGSLAITLADLSLSLGESVGVLLAGLVCGWFYNRKPRAGHIPQATRLFLQSLGLNLYIGVLALRVGGSFREAMSGNGWLILLLGAAVTLVPHILSLFFGKFILRIDDADLLGGLCGSGTCTSALNALTDETNSSVFTLGFAPGCAAGNILLTVMGSLLPLLF